MLIKLQREYPQRNLNDAYLRSDVVIASWHFTKKQKGWGHPF
jgi:hypothetical protein